MKDSDGFFKFLILLVLGYFLYRHFMMPRVHSAPVVVQYDPYLDRIDGVYGRASANGIPRPYPQLTGPGPKAPYGAPEWIL